MSYRPNRWNSSLTPMNHRYRGASEQAKYQNYLGQTLHDLITLAHWMDGDHRPFRLQSGQTDTIRYHFARYTTGTEEQGDLRATLPTAGRVQRTEPPDQRLAEVPLTDWTIENDEWVTVSSTDEGIHLATDQERTAITYPLYIEEPASFVLRVALRAETPEHPWVSIGSPNADDGSAVWETHRLPDDGSVVWIETILEVPQTQTVRLGIRPHQPDAFTPNQYEPQDYEILAVEWRPFQDTPVQLAPISRTMATQVADLEARLHALRSDI